MSKSSLQDTVLISAESLLPIIQKHLNKLTSVQWAMLGTGQLDSNSQALLVDLVTEIIHKATADAFQIVLPLFQQNTAFRVHVKTLAGDALSKVFAKFFDLSEVKGKSTRKLTHMVEEEVNKKVGKLLSETVKSSKSQEKCESSSFASTLKRWLAMVSNAAKILGSCTRRFKIDQMLESVEESQSESDQPTDNQETIDYSSLTDGVTDILKKWTTKMTPLQRIKGNISNPSAPDDEAFRATAASIVNVLMESMQGSGPTEARTLPMHRPDMSAVVDQVRDFFNKHIPELDDDKWYFFRKFSYDKVDLIVDNLRYKATSSNISEWEITEAEEDYIPLKPDSITNDLLTLFNGISELQEPILQDSITCCGLLEEFSLALTEQLFQDVMYERQQNFPNVQHLPTNSNQPFTPSRRALTDNEKNFLHKATKEAVEKLMAQVFLWFRGQMTHSDRIFGALTDIEDLLLHELGRPNMKSLTPHSSWEVEFSSLTEDENDSYSVSNWENDSSSVPKGENEYSCATEDENEFSCATEDEHEEDPHQRWSTSGDEMFSDVESLESVESEEEHITESNTLIILLLVQALSHYMKKTKNRQEKDEIQTIIQRLSHLALSDQNSEFLHKEEEIREIKEVLFRALCQDFGSSEGLLEASMALDDPSFIQTIIVCLKEKFNVTSAPRRKSRTKMFFSHVGKLMTGFFRRWFKTPE